MANWQSLRSRKQHPMSAGILYMPGLGCFTVRTVPTVMMEMSALARVLVGAGIQGAAVPGDTRGTLV